MVRLLSMKHRSSFKEIGLVSSDGAISIDPPMKRRGSTDGPPRWIEPSEDINLYQQLHQLEAPAAAGCSGRAGNGSDLVGCLEP